MIIGQKSATTDGALNYDKKIDPHLERLGGDCDELGSPLAPPVGEELEKKLGINGVGLLMLPMLNFLSFRRP